MYVCACNASIHAGRLHCVCKQLFSGLCVYVKCATLSGLCVHVICLGCLCAQVCVHV